MSGWIKLHRKIQEHWLFNFNEPDKAMAFIDLVLSASYSDTSILIKGRLYKIGRGQFLVSQSTLQKRWKWSQNKVARFLKLLENDQIISVEADERTSIITICNYKEYQSNERTDERTDGSAGERTANVQANDIQEYKNNKEVKNKKRSAKSTDFEPSTKLTYSDRCFEIFWKQVEKKGSDKSAAKKAFEKYTQGKTDDEIDFVLNVICHFYELYIQSNPDLLLPENKKYIKAAATWLNSAPWRVELDAYAEFKREYYGATE